MDPASTDTQIKKAATERAEIRAVITPNQEGWFYTIMGPLVIIGWVLIIIFLIL
jgi:hypothetical protein